MINFTPLGYYSLCATIVGNRKRFYHPVLREQSQLLKLNNATPFTYRTVCYFPAFHHNSDIAIRFSDLDFLKRVRIWQLHDVSRCGLDLWHLTLSLEPDATSCVASWNVFSNNNHLFNRLVIERWAYRKTNCESSWSVWYFRTRQQALALMTSTEVCGVWVPGENLLTAWPLCLSVKQLTSAVLVYTDHRLPVYYLQLPKPYHAGLRHLTAFREEAGKCLCDQWSVRMSAQLINCTSARYQATWCRINVNFSDGQA